MSQRIDYNDMAERYDAGRALPAEWLSEWPTVLDPYLSSLDAPVLDIGSGTGIWSLLFAQWFDLDVVAVEPSEGMRSQAQKKRAHDRVRYAGGEAEHLPLRDESCAAAWMSTVVHHVPDLRRAAREIRRVLVPGGPVLIRNAFSGRHDGVVWTRFFPAALRIAESRHPKIDAVVEAFEVAGFEREALRSVSETSAASPQDYISRIETRSDSTLTLISDEEFERGLAELRRAAESSPARPVRTTLDLLVLRQPSRDVRGP